MQESLNYIDASEPKIVDNEHLLKVEDIKSEKDIDSNGATGEDPSEIENATVLVHDGKKQIQVNNFRKVFLFTQQVQVVPSFVRDCKKTFHQNRLFWGLGIGYF